MSQEKKTDDRGIAYILPPKLRQRKILCQADQTDFFNPLAFFIRTFMKPYKNKTYRPAFYTEASLTWPSSSLNSSSTTQWDI